MRVDEVTFSGYECLRLRAGDLELMVTHSAGPRILRFRRSSQPNMLVLLPDTVIERPEGNPFRFLGGHRLWVAPEIPAVTYAPDDASVDVTISTDEVTLSSQPDAAGYRKTITIELERDHATITHQIANHGPKRSVAPWAITQLVPGGTALVPIGTPTAGPYQASGNVVAWPYSDWSDPLVRIERDQIEIDAKRIDPIKFGTTLHRGWLAYKLDGQLFVKRAATQPDRCYPDFGASGQCYAIRSFIELETLGPLQELGEGETATHIETWELHDVDPSEPIGDVASGLELDR